MVAVFFVCMDLLYPNPKGSLPQSGRSEEGPSESTRQTPTRESNMLREARTGEYNGASGFDGKGR